MITILLLVHGLLAVALLGAITHQALSVVAAGTASGRRSFFARFRSVNGPAYAGPIVVMFVLTATLGAFLYPQYRIDVRVLLEDTQSRSANGIFEIKEHLISDAQILKLPEPVAASKIVDFTLQREVLRELGIK